MIRYPLIHPELLGALAAAGHGSQVLLADGNFPHGTGANPAAARIHLNLAPGLLDVDQVLDVLLTAIPVEAAAIMSPADATEVPATTGYRSRLADVPFTSLERTDFYEAARGRDVAIVIATGDQRLYANLLLTIGVREP
jgi:L-fucose mutarotase